MKYYACDKCGSVDLFIDDRGKQKALMCGDCGSWIKWVGKKEMPLVERFIKEMKSDNPIVKSFEEDIYFHREREENWNIQDKAEEVGFRNTKDLRYFGEELELKVEVREDMKHKIISINGVNVSDKEIYI